MSKRNQQFQTIRTEGAILPPDILRRIASLKVDGATGDAYHLPPRTKPNEAITQAWGRLRQHWQAFQEAREALSESDETATSVTNEQWLLPLFNELGYGRLITTKAPEIDERVYPIERFYNHTPIHLIGCKLPLDRRTKGARGAATASPHSMVQEYLNRSEEHLWAFLSNGLQLRILRDNVSLSRQAYVEFDLEGMMEGEVTADFALLWLLCHQSRVETEKPQDCWLEKWSQLAREEGTRVLKDLRVGVAKAIEALGRGFIGHPRNDLLREKLRSGTLSKEDYYRQLLRIVYRMLFLFVAEDRELLHPPESSDEARTLYDTHYSTRRLRDLALRIRGSKHADLWHSLSLVFDALGRNEGCPQLGLCGLGSFLWRRSSTQDLLGTHQISGDTQEPALITNDDLLLALRELAYVEQDRVLRGVDYRNLGSEELGSVYEALLELHPVMNVEAKGFELLTAVGNERKITGSYYTPDSLVQCLLDSALDPVVEDRLKGKKGEEAEQALLDIKVCDPACGSGHFLIAAAHRLARHLARVRTGESEPSPEDYQHSLRDVIGHCVYGVDINPMAVELCKVSLWMEAIEPGKPLSFLDHHIQCGNSLLGTTPALLAKGIPDEAFKPIEGDEKQACSNLKKDNKRQRQEYQSGQGYLFAPLMKLGNLPATISQINVADDESLEDVNAKQDMYERMVKGADYLNACLLADTWCASFVWKKDNSDLGQSCPTERYFRNIENNPRSILPHVHSEVRRLADQYQFFHWHLAFPDVFVLPEEAGKAENEQTGWSRGFDLVLGNPPWEKVEVLDREVGRWSEEVDNDDAQIARRAKEQLRQLERMTDCSRSFIRESGRFPLCGQGRINSYSAFAELNSQVIGEGFVGCVLPPGIATDDSTKEFIQYLTDNHFLKEFFAFTNRGYIFREIESTLSFALVTYGRKEVASTKLAAQLWQVAHLDDPGRVYSLPLEMIRKINPNTRNLPILQSTRDAALVGRIHTQVPVLEDESRSDNPWLSDFKQGLFNMTTKKSLFRSFEALEQEGLSFNGADFTNNATTFKPLYEAKLTAQFNHRHGTFEGVPESQRFGTRAQTIKPAVSLLASPEWQPRPRYWVDSAEVEATIPEDWQHGWFIGFRNAISAVADSRSVAFVVVPRVGIGNSMPILFLANDIILRLSAFGCFNSFVLDYVARQKAAGGNLNFYVMKQLPILPPCRFEELQFVSGPIWFARRVLELTYTAWDLEAFALDCGYDGPPFRWDEERRFLLRCELDAAYFHLYLGSPSEWGTDSPQIREMFPTPRDAVEYIMETFPIVKRKDIARTARKDDSGEVTQEGRYITKDTILEIYDEMQQAIDSGQPYQTRLDPPPGPPTDQDGNFTPMAQWDTNDWPRHIHPAPRSVESATSKERRVAK